MHPLFYVVCGVCYIAMVFISALVLKDTNKESSEERMLRLTFSSLWPILLLMLGTFLLGEGIFQCYQFVYKIRGKHVLHTNSFATGNLSDKILTGEKKSNVP